MHYLTQSRALKTLALVSLLYSKFVHAEPVVLHYSQWLPTAHWSQSEVLYPWFDQIAEVTDGRVIVKPSRRPMVPPTKNYQAVVDGTIDLAYSPHGYHNGPFALTEFIERPFITINSAHSSAAYWTLWEQYFEETGMHDGMVTLAVHVISGGNLHMREHPVNSIDDLQDKRIRAPSRVIGRALEQLGSDSIMGQLRAVAPLMSTGKVDGTALADNLALSFGVIRNIKHVTHIPGGLYTNSIFLAVNQQKWDEISPADQAAIRGISGKSLSRAFGQQSQNAESEAREKLQGQLGNQYSMATPSFIVEMKKISLSEKQRWISEAERMGLDGNEILDVFQSLLAEEQNFSPDIE